MSSSQDKITLFIKEIAIDLEKVIELVKVNKEYELSEALEILYSIDAKINSTDINAIVPEHFKTLIATAGLIISSLNINKEKNLIGRPSYDIDSNQLNYLIEKGFTVTQIANFYSVSKVTIFRRLKENGIKMRNAYTKIGDNELSDVVLNILLQHPNTGYKRMKGFLRAENIKITDLRVRHIMRQVDPEGVRQRTIKRNKTIKRRQYFVKYSNQLWHIDGNAKLIRWNIVVRAGMDGKSRLITYISATNNNRADTHLQAFLQGCESYGIPLRTRSDKGGENIMIAEYMIEKRGTGRSSHICGRSVHNQRIERFWRDLFEGCLSNYYQLFYKLEDDGILIIDNQMHISILHHVFLPRLNQHLQSYANGWNKHPLSTESNRTPEQLMIMHLPPANLDIFMTEEEKEDLEFACQDTKDLEGFYESLEVNEEANIDCLISSSKLEEVKQIDVLAHSDAFGYEIFANILKIVEG